MTLYEFVQADTDQKALAVWDSILIASRAKGNYRMRLYYWGSSYVKVVYDVAKNQSVNLNLLRKEFFWILFEDD